MRRAPLVETTLEEADSELLDVVLDPELPEPVPEAVTRVLLL